jgi:hypothetical protein
VQHLIATDVVDRDVQPAICQPRTISNACLVHRTPPHKGRSVNRHAANMALHPLHSSPWSMTNAHSNQGSWPCTTEEGPTSSKPAFSYSGIKSCLQMSLTDVSGVVACTYCRYACRSWDGWQEIDKSGGTWQWHGNRPDLEWGGARGMLTMMAQIQTIRSCSCQPPHLEHLQCDAFPPLVFPHTHRVHAQGGAIRVVGAHCLMCEPIPLAACAACVCDDLICAP